MACCDFCIYVAREPVYCSVRIIVDSVPSGCRLYEDAEHQDIAESCGYCPDFHCFRANEDNMVVKEIDDV